MTWIISLVEWLDRAIFGEPESPRQALAFWRKRPAHPMDDEIDHRSDYVD